MMEIMSGCLGTALSGLPSTPVALAAGQLLFHRGDPVRRTYVVDGGAVHLVRHHADGSALVLQRAVAGDMLAEASLFAEHYHCDAVAVVPSRLRAMPRAAVLARLGEGKGLAEALAAHLAAQVQNARQRAEILSLRTVAQRLDAWLAGNAGALPAKGAWKRVAMEIGVSPEALYREFAARRARGATPPTRHDF
jgi:CRP/FNR family transcriptional regulator, dissimilatory nitrate respiration regulator